MNLTDRNPYQKPEKCRLTASQHRSHLEAVKGLPCAVCGAPGPSDAHHVICGRYGTRKPCDCNVIPLCKAHHQDGPEAIHNGKHTWVQRFGNDYDYLPRTREMVEAGWDNQALGEWF